MTCRGQVCGERKWQINVWSWIKKNEQVWCLGINSCITEDGVSVASSASAASAITLCIIDMQLI